MYSFKALFVFLATISLTAVMAIPLNVPIRRDVIANLTSVFTVAFLSNVSLPYASILLSTHELNSSDFFPFTLRPDKSLAALDIRNLNPSTDAATAQVIYLPS